MYRALRCIIASVMLMMLPSWVRAKTPDMHVVIFADTGDSSIGESVATDVKTVRNMVGEISKVLAEDGVKTDVQVFSGSNCSYSKLQSFLKSFDCKDDIVFFVYNGHGGRSHDDDATSKFPRMCLGSHYVNEWMKISDLNDKLRSKNPRLMVVLTDCCNSYYDRRSHGDESSIMSAPMRIDGQGIRELFLNNKGEVCITAASPGEYGWCNQAGGYLTLNFKNELQKIDKKGSAATWQELFKNTSDETYKETKKQYDAHYITKTQRPVYDVKVNKSPADSNNDNNGGNNNGGGNNGGGDNGGSNNGGGDNGGGDNGGGNNGGGNSIDNNDDYDDYDDYDDTDYDSDEVEVDEDGNPVIHAAHNFGKVLMHSLIIFIIGLVFMMLPKWLKIDGTLSTILKVIGVLIILKALYDFVTML